MTLSHGRRKTSLFSALLDESGLKPSLATTHAKAFTPCDRDPLGLMTKARGTVLGSFLGRGWRHTCSAVCSSCQNEARGKGM
ncbi:hypothetical protein [Desulfosporosinus shakirovi]|uniref:hypothetical protein n=1 Tax=Desulfosporosinus shakirovi TaxID=2885154 RepID=UPI001E29BBA8|nr:hypothetical protein [Desulfosporosinus sp. SRJS8]MCB8815747.1 hypothetical protein [Desulfosporosinus sp. SRJS8]